MSFWSVAQTECQRERTAARFLEQAGFETYLPVIRASSSSRERLVPLFPQYLFVRIERGWWRIDNTVGVVEVLKSGERPAVLPDNQLDKIRGQERDGVVRLKPRGPIIGKTRLRILRGSFVDHIGLFDGMSTHQRQWVLLEMLGAKTRVELPSRDLRAVEN